MIEKFGLDYESVQAINPDVIYLSLTGFGPVGPKAKHPATDSVMQAFTGVMSINRDAEGTPQRVDYYAIDVITGLYAFQAVSSALYRRAIKGGGKHIRTSLMESALAFQEPKMIEYVLEGGAAEPIGAPVGTFQTSDGFICINARRDPHFQALFRLIGREAMIDDPRYADARSRVTNREDLLAILRDVVATKTTDEWVDLLNGIDVLNAPVSTYGDLFEHPQVAAVEAIRWVENDTVGRIPMGSIAGLPPVGTDNPRTLAPHIGQHSVEILAELGYDEAAIEALRADGTVAVQQLAKAAE